MLINVMNLTRIFNFTTATTARNYARVCINAVNINNNYQYGFEKQIRRVSSVEAKHFQKEEGLVRRVLKKIPFLNVEKTRTMAAAYLFYEEIADKINYIEFFDELELPDTFYSWFVITELHIWIISVRAMAEGDDVGKLLRNSLIEALWKDVNQRVKHLGAHNPSVTRGQIAELSEQLQAALIAYDEGLQSNDMVLAGALWRRFYQQKDVDPRWLDLLVKYIRKHIRILDNMSREQLMSEKSINWEPLKK